MFPHKSVTRDRLGAHLHTSFRMRQASCDFKVMSNGPRKQQKKTVGLGTFQLKPFPCVEVAASGVNLPPPPHCCLP